LSLIAYTKNIATDDPISLFLTENGYHSAETLKKFRRYRRFETWMTTDGLIVNTDHNIAKHTVVSKVFTFGKSYFSHVVMSCTHREATPGLLDLFACLVEILGYYVEREWDAGKNYNYVYNSLIIELMGCRVTPANVQERARIVGIHSEDKYVVMLPSEDTNGGSAFPERMARDISQMFCNVRPVYFSMRLMFFLHHSNVGSIIDEGLPQLDGYFRECNILCGISDVFDDLLELPDAYRQAEIALSESGLAVPGWCGAVRFDAYYAWCLFDRSERAVRVLETSRYGKMLAELRRADGEKNTNNFEVLRIYLINGSRATETAAALHMHRNNVAYRIGRIEEMMGISLDDWRTRKNLLITMLAMCTI
jgi:sugar diacid utilization regulator